VSDGVLLASIPMVPLLAAVAAFAAPRAARWIGLTALLALMPLGYGLVARVIELDQLAMDAGGWPTPLGIELRADGLSVILLATVVAMGLLVSVHAAGYFGSPARNRIARYFWPLWLFVIASLAAMFLSGDVFNLYVTLELMGLAAVSLVALAGSPSSRSSALQYLFVSLTGSLCYLMGVALLYGGFGTVDLALLADRMTAEPFSLVALVLMTAGLLMKAALFPMHFWLPPAHSSAPAPVSAALSALVVKGGLYVLLRLWFGVFSAVIPLGAAQWLGVLGAAAIVWGSVQALFQRRLKLLIAYSTVAQMGYLFLAFPLAWRGDGRATVWAGAVVLLLSHAAAKSAMFLAAGNVQRATGRDDLDGLKGVTRLLPVSAFAIGLAGVSLVGLPPSAGFVGKWLLIGVGLEQGQWWWIAVILVGSLLAAGYMARVLGRAFVSASEAPAEGKVSVSMEWSALALALMSVLLGFFASVPARLLAQVMTGRFGQ
jgi:formate hydrogenlyase subunit 3/multisubunit Na+/H+ antiporter MnhD subunit